MGRRIASRQLLEREAERAALWAAFERALGGEATVCVVIGEAGIGKTRLITELEARVRASGALTLVGHCMEFDGVELPYAPLAGALRDLPAEVVAEAHTQLPARARVELSRAFSSLWPDDKVDPSESPSIDRFAQTRLFEFVLALLRIVSRSRPALLVVEDLHWADGSTRDLLRFLEHNVQRERLAIVLTCRQELPEGHPARRLLGEMLRSDLTECLHLKPLSRSAVAAQVRALVPEPAPPGLADELFARSNGNPFLAEELLAARLAGQPPQDLPWTLQDSLRARIGEISREARLVLRAIAAIGRPTSSDLLALVAGIEPTALIDRLREVMQRHVVVKFGDDAFGFRHELVREVIYNELLPSERCELHTRIAQALADHEEAEAWGELAFHWRAAGRHAESLDASIRAGVQAESARAFGEALEHLERVLELFTIADMKASPLPLERSEARFHAARLARYCGNYELAIKRCDEALAELGPAGDRLRAAELYELRGRCQSYADDCGLASFRRALELLPAGRDAERARLLGAEGYALVGLFRWREARERCVAAVALAQDAGATEAEAFARARLGLALGFLGEGTAGEAHLLWARTTSEGLGLAEDLLYTYVFLGEVRRLRGRLEAAHEAMAEGAECARRLGMGASFGRFMALNAAADLVLLGRWREAQACLDEEHVGRLEPWQALLRHQVAAQLAVARGDFDAAAQQLERGRKLCEEGSPEQYLPGVFAVLGEFALWRGVPEEACSAVDEALGRLSDKGDVLNTPVLYWIGARACADSAERARLGSATTADANAHRRRAAALLTELDVLLERAGGPEPAPLAIAYRSLCEAEVARAAGEYPVDAWRLATEAWRSLGVPYVAAYADWRHGEALLTRSGGRDAARRGLGEALSTAEALAAEPLRREIQALVQRAHLDLRREPVDTATEAPVHSGADERPLGLTARELEVLELLAQGLTNRQIAKRLVISERTAGVHVSHILAKLDAPNRVIAAGIAHRLQLLTSASAGTGAISDSHRG